MNIPEDQQQSLIEHLTELRKRLVRSLFFVLIGFGICWGFSDYIFNFIRGPIEPFLKTDSGGLVFTAPMDKFMAHLKISILAGIILSCPFWFHQLWKFVAPGLYQNEKKWAFGFVSFGSILFLVGVSFSFYVVMPAAFEFLLGFGGTAEIPMITIDKYISFFIATTLVFGLAFEMPLILTILGMIGIIDAEFLSSKRRYAVVVLAALSALATPPDVISMILMLIPLLGLYEISIVLVRILGAKKPLPA